MDYVNQRFDVTGRLEAIRPSMELYLALDGSPGDLLTRADDPVQVIYNDTMEGVLMLAFVPHDADITGEYPGWSAYPPDVRHDIGRLSDEIGSWLRARAAGLPSVCMDELGFRMSLLLPVFPLDELYKQVEEPMDVDLVVRPWFPETNA